MQDTELQARLAALAADAGKILGLTVLVGSHMLSREWTTATLPWRAEPLGIVSPDTADQVAPFLALASRHGVPVHPVARGRSWGLGSRLPPRSALILDLSRLDRILALDMAAGTVRVEPGVTFAALQARLKAEGLAFHVPSFGGPIEASVLANALERGEGAGSHGDRFSHLWDLDVALSTGERFRTGHSRHGSEGLSALHGRPAGPLVEGLFSQSGMGVVLSARLALQPTLPYACSLIAELGGSDHLRKAVAILRRLISSGMVAPHSLALWNGAKRASSLVGRHFSEVETLCVQPRHFGASVALAAPHPEMMSLIVRLVSDELRQVTTEIAVQSDRTEDGRRLETPLTGFSDGNNVMSTYWGKAERPDRPGNPDLDGCGFLWLCPAIPFSAEAIMAVDRLLEEATASRPLFPALGFQAVSARALHAYISLAWDRKTDGADDEAMAAHDRIAKGLNSLGFAPYRLGLPTIEALPQASDDWPAVLKRLREALDPHGIISPGRIPQS